MNDLYKKYDVIIANEVRYETHKVKDDNEILVVAFGTASRVVRSAVDELNAEGHSIGLIRPITVWPFPYAEIAKAIGPKVKKVYVFELNTGQMLEDVKLAVNGKVPVDFWARWEASSSPPLRSKQNWKPVSKGGSNGSYRDKTSIVHPDPLHLLSRLPARCGASPHRGSRGRVWIDQQDDGCSPCGMFRLCL